MATNDKNAPAPETFAPFICNRPFSAWGKEYGRGDPVDPKDWKGPPQAVINEAWANRLRSRDVVTPTELEVIKTEEAEAEAEATTGRASRKR